MSEFNVFEYLRTQNTLCALPFISTKHEQATTWKMIRQTLLDLMFDVTLTMLFSLCLYNYYTHENMKELLHFVSIFGVAFQIVTRVVIIKWKRSQITRLVRNIEEAVEDYDERFHEIWIKRSRIPKHIINHTFVFSGVLIVAFYASTIYQAIFKPNEFEIVLIIHWPFDHKSTLLRRLTAVVLIVVSGFNMVKVYVIQNSVYLILHMITGQLQYIKIKWDQTFTGEVLPEKEQFKQLVNLHQRVLEICSQVNSILSPLLFSSLLGILWSVVALGPCVVTDKYFTLSERVSGASLVISFLVQLGLICHVIEQVQHAHNSISESAYNSEVTKGSKWLHSCLQFAHQRCFINVRFTALGFFTPALSTFADLARLIFSATLALIQIVELAAK